MTRSAVCAKVSVKIKGDKLISLGDYTAKEHKLKLNEVVIAEKELNGWIWCNKEEEPDVFAWAPLNHLQKV